MKGRKALVIIAPLKRLEGLGVGPASILALGFSIWSSPHCKGVLLEIHQFNIKQNPSHANLKHLQLNYFKLPQDFSKIMCRHFLKYLNK